MTFEVTFGMLDENHTPIATHNLQQWMKFVKDFERNCVVKQEAFSGGVRLSTVFLVSTYPDLETRLFESLVFGGKYTNYGRKYWTWDEAAEGHELIAKALRQGAQPYLYLDKP